MLLKISDSILHIEQDKFHMKPQTDGFNGIEVEFMFKEYERLSSLIVAEHQQAEQRVNFFISIATASVGAVLLLFQISNVAQGTKLAIIESILIVQLLFGITILNRLAARSKQLKAYNRLLSEIRLYFAEHCPQVSAYSKVYSNPLDSSHPTCRSVFLRHLINRLRGSFTDLMLLANSLLVGGIFLVVLLSAELNLILAFFVTAITVLISLVLFGIYYQFIGNIISLFDF
jgi:hypothetical protein